MEAFHQLFARFTGLFRAGGEPPPLAGDGGPIVRTPPAGSPIQQRSRSRRRTVSPTSALPRSAVPPGSRRSTASPTSASPGRSVPQPLARRPQALPRPIRSPQDFVECLIQLVERETVRHDLETDIEILNTNIAKDEGHLDHLRAICNRLKDRDYPIIKEHIDDIQKEITEVEESLEASDGTRAKFETAADGLIRDLFSVAQDFIDASFESGKIGPLQLGPGWATSLLDAVRCRELLDESEENLTRLWQRRLQCWRSGDSEEVRAKCVKDHATASARATRARKTQRDLESAFICSKVEPILISHGLLTDPSSPTGASSDADMSPAGSRFDGGLIPVPSPPEPHELWLRVRNSRYSYAAVTKNYKNLTNTYRESLATYLCTYSNRTKSSFDARYTAQNGISFEDRTNRALGILAARKQAYEEARAAAVSAGIEDLPLDRIDIADQSDDGSTYTLGAAADARRQKAAPRIGRRTRRYVRRVIRDQVLSSPTVTEVSSRGSGSIRPGDSLSRRCSETPGLS